MYKNQQVLREEEATQEQVLPGSSRAAAQPSIEELTSTSIPSLQVFRFVHHCLRYLLPKALLGSKKNWRRFSSSLRVLIQSQSRDTFQLDVFTSRIELSSIRWLAVKGSPSPATAKQTVALFNAFVLFLLKSVVVCELCGTHSQMPLLSTHFYITDTTFAYHSPLFYRKPVYSGIVHGVMEYGSYSLLFHQVHYDVWVLSLNSRVEAKQHASRQSAVCPQNEYGQGDLLRRASHHQHASHVVAFFLTDA